MMSVSTGDGELHYQRTEVRVHKGDAGTDVADYELITKTTYGSDETEFLPVKVERVRVAGDTGAITGTESDIETTTYAYGFHSETMRSIAWVKTTVEGELPSENGPTPAVVESVEIPTAYSSWEMYDTRGLNTWSIAADGSRTKRVFDNDASSPTSVSFTGSVIAVVQNADATNDGFPSTGELPSGLPEDRNTESTAGEQSLTTTYTRDVLGRVQKVIGPGGNTRITTREMRLNDERPGLKYYSETHLPHSISSTVFDGPATITWINAGDKAFETQGLKPTASYSVPGTVEDYRQVVDDYTLDTVNLLARSYMVQHVSGLNEEVRQWFDPSSSTAYYKTMYEYDELGRVAVVIGPTDEAGTTGTKTQTTYDFKNRVKTTSVSAIGSVTWSEVEQRYYDSATTTEGVGNGNLTYVKRIIDGSTNDRTTTFIYDFRDRRVGTLNPLAPHQAVAYDNLGRVVQSATLSGNTAATAFTSTDADRVSYLRTSYSQRGLPFRSETAIDPTVASGSATYLVSNSWFDAAGRVVGAQAPSSPGRKTSYDGLGRVSATYTTDNAGFASYSDVHASHASVLTANQVIEQVETRYITASNSGKGMPDLVTTRRRVHDDDEGEGSLASATAVVSYSGMFYDDAGRVAMGAEYGTCLDTFSTGGTAPDPDQEDPPTPSATILANSMTYDARGLVATVTDSAGIVTKSLYDGLGRQYATIENYINATVAWDAVAGAWIASDVGTTDGTDRVTSTVYDAQGRVAKYIAHQAYDPAPGERDQVTTYTYGVSPSDTHPSAIWTHDLLKTVTYQDSGVVSYAYNAQGELVLMVDQNSTEHVYTRDALGRVTRDEATPGGDIDAAIVAISRDYDGAGRLKRVASWDDGPAVVNDLRFGYTPLGQVESVWQNSVDVITTTGSSPNEVPVDPPTGSTRLVAYTYATAVAGSGNYSRLSQMDYPRNLNSGSPVTAALEYSYAGLNSSISRASGLEIDSTPIVGYDYIGGGVFAQVDYMGYSADVQLDRTLSEDGKRNTQGYSTQDAGIYPGLDRFGRVIRQDWVDGELTVNGSLSTVPNRPQIVAIGYAYDAAGNRTQMVDRRPGSNWAHSWAYGYDGLKRLTLGTHGAWNGSTVSASAVSQAWTLDILGNWEEWKRDYNTNGSFASSETETREHDWTNNELTAREEDSVPLEGITYDAAGNMRTRTAGTVVTTYVHDAWNRLVKVSRQDGSDPVVEVLEQQFNGLNWRTLKRANTQPSPVWDVIGYTEPEEPEEPEPIYGWVEQPLGTALDEERQYAYNASWQLLEERVDVDYTDNSAFETDTRIQHVWGIRYIDDPVLFRRDTDNDGDYESSLMHLTDAMFSTVALIDWATASVVERVSYDPYGKPQGHPAHDITGDGVVNSADLGALLAGWKSTMAPGYNGAADFDFDGDVDGADLGALYSAWSAEIPEGVLSSAGNTVGFDGYMFDQETQMYTVRHRTYEPVLGRWIERDPLVYHDGANVFQYAGGMPTISTDPSGTAWWIIPVAVKVWELYETISSCTPVIDCVECAGKCFQGGGGEVLDRCDNEYQECLSQDPRDVDDEYINSQEQLMVYCFVKYDKCKKNFMPKLIDFFSPTDWKSSPECDACLNHCGSTALDGIIRKRILKKE